MIIKNSPSRSKKVLLCIFLVCWVGLIVFTGYFIYNNYFLKNIEQQTESSITVTHVDETEVSKEKKDEYTVPNPKYPRYLSIPKININNSRVVQLGLVNNTKQLSAPYSIFDAGWYTGSSTPGSGSGAVLMDGHNGGPTKDGIFKNLSSLAEGDDLVIERGDGKKITYTIKDIRQMLVSEINNPKNKYGMVTMLQSIEPSKEGLNIITCVGEWDQRNQTYNKRVMVRAVRKN